MSKLYKREGRRFVEVPDYTGMYYNEDDTFSKERMPNSIAKCVLQTPSYRLVHALDVIKGLNWYNAKEQCKTFLGCGYLPSRLELCYVGREYSNVFLWSIDECSSDYAWSWYWNSSAFADFSYVDKNPMYLNVHALPFAKLQI